MKNVDADIPEVILKAEKARAETPAQEDRPGSLGFPALPTDLLRLAVRYLPVLALAGAAAAAFNAFSLFGAPAEANSFLVFLAALSCLVVSVIMGLSYIWLSERRRLGWNALALALVLGFLAQALASGVGSLLYAGIEILLTAYVMLQLRDSFSE